MKLRFKRTFEREKEGRMREKEPANFSTPWLLRSNRSCVVEPTEWALSQHAYSHPPTLTLSHTRLHTPSHRLDGDEDLVWVSRSRIFFGELTELQTSIIFSFSVVPFNVINWLSWNYQKSLLVLCKINPEDFSLIGSIDQECSVNNKKLWQTRLWHHQYMYGCCHKRVCHNSSFFSIYS